MKPAVILATFADMKFIKSRSVVQYMFEAPLEQAEQGVDILGTPRHGSEVWCAIARLATPGEPAEPVATEEPKPRRDRAPLQPSARAALICKDKAFWSFLVVDDEPAAIVKLRAYCGVESRSDLNENREAEAKFNTLETDFKVWAGRVAERR